MIHARKKLEFKRITACLDGIAAFAPFFSGVVLEEVATGDFELCHPDTVGVFDWHTFIIHLVSRQASFTTFP